MIMGSITIRLLSFITAAFFVTTLSVLILANNQLHDIIDSSQSDVYFERLETIIGTLNRKAQRLKLTGMVEAYEKDFKESILKTLRQIYYKTADQRIYPVVFDSGGGIVMHPTLLPGDMSVANSEYLKKVLELKYGDSRYTDEDGKEKWIIFKYFQEWNWVIGYTVPLDIKYADARQFHRYCWKSDGEFQRRRVRDAYASDE